MAYDEKFADRAREIISLYTTDIAEKKMFGGVCFMVHDKMCIGVQQDTLMVRFDPAQHDTILERGDCRPMDFTGRVMKGYCFVDIDTLTSRKKLDYWIQLALAYNKQAKPSKKKKA